MINFWIRNDYLTGVQASLQCKPFPLSKICKYLLLCGLLSSENTATECATWKAHTTNCCKKVGSTLLEPYNSVKTNMWSACCARVCCADAGYPVLSVEVIAMSASLRVWLTSLLCVQGCLSTLNHPCVSKTRQDVLGSEQATAIDDVWTEFKVSTMINELVALTVSLFPIVGRITSDSTEYLQRFFYCYYYYSK